MALNKFMHPRNPYRTPPDFRQLAIEYPEFRKYVQQDLSGKIRLDFKNEEALKALTKCLLDKDFGFTINLPSNRLVPTLPLRLNYLLWIEDLLNSCSLANAEVRGVDIGTGASCIYPVLAVKKFSWKMLATEVDEESTKSAILNITSNNLTEDITVKKVTEDVVLVGALEDGVDYHFCMCNPPFFSDESQLEMKNKSRSESRSEPRNAHTGSVEELVVVGGDVGFVSRIIDDSTSLRSRIKIYTVMIGHKSSMGQLKKRVKEAGAVSMTTTQFCQGRTIRWGLAWTFCADLDLVRVEKASGFPSHCNKPPLKISIPAESITLSEVKQKILDILDNLQIIVTSRTEESKVFGMTIRAERNTWSHRRRARRKQKMREAQSEKVSPLSDGCKTTGFSSEKRELEDDGDEGSSRKKTKSSSPSNSDTLEEPFKNEGQILVAASLIIYDLDTEFSVEISYIEGTGGREATNQILLYIKNHFMHNVIL